MSKGLRRVVPSTATAKAWKEIRERERELVDPSSKEDTCNMIIDNNYTPYNWANFLKKICNATKIFEDFLGELNDHGNAEILQTNERDLVRWLTKGKPYCNFLR